MHISHAPLHHPSLIWHLQGTAPCVNNIMAQSYNDIVLESLNGKSSITPVPRQRKSWVKELQMERVQSVCLCCNYSEGGWERTLVEASFSSSQTLWLLHTQSKYWWLYFLPFRGRTRLAVQRLRITCSSRSGSRLVTQAKWLGENVLYEDDGKPACWSVGLFSRLLSTSNRWKCL